MMMGKKKENQNIGLENQSKLLDQIGIELLALGNISNVIGTYFNINEQLKENDYLIITGTVYNRSVLFRSRSSFVGYKCITENYYTG